MPLHGSAPETGRASAPPSLLRYALKWAVLGSAMAVLAGSASALFLWALEEATQTREQHRWLIALLPVVGYGVGWLYLKWGQSVEAGNNLLIDEIHQPRSVVPLRMAPLILGATVASHLVGASVGREGTAVQMGGSLADQLTRWCRLDSADRRLVLMAGMAAGFAAVFGTPLAGAVFAMEVLVVGKVRQAALYPCVVAALVADRVCVAWGAQHAHYAVPQVPAWTLAGTAAVVALGVASGWLGRSFAWGTHRLSGWMKQRISHAPLRPLVGGSVLAALVLAAPASWSLDRYLGLGLPVIAQAFEQPLSGWDVPGKLLLTVLSLGTGFKGGEVTPLFYLGATLGNGASVLLAPWLDMPLAFMAALGFVAVFAGAANTPLACTLMAMELFGAPLGGFAMLACVVSFLCSGHAGIYKAQRVPVPKHSPHADD